MQAFVVRIRRRAQTLPHSNQRALDFPLQIQARPLVSRVASRLERLADVPRGVGVGCAEAERQETIQSQQTVAQHDLQVGLRCGHAQVVVAERAQTEVCRPHGIGRRASPALARECAVHARVRCAVSIGDALPSLRRLEHVQSVVAVREPLPTPVRERDPGRIRVEVDVVVHNDLADLLLREPPHQQRPLHPLLQLPSIYECEVFTCDGADYTARGGIGPDWTGSWRERIVLVEGLLHVSFFQYDDL